MTLTVDSFDLSPAYLGSSLMKKGRDFEYDGDKMTIPPEYLERRIEALKFAYKVVELVEARKIEFKDAILIISNGLRTVS